MNANVRSGDRDGLSVGGIVVEETVEIERIELECPPPSARSELESLEDEQLQLVAEIADLRRSATVREGELLAQLKDVYGLLARRDQEIADQEAQIAALTQRCRALQGGTARLDGDAPPRAVDRGDPAGEPALRRYLISLDPEGGAVHELSRTLSYAGRGSGVDLQLPHFTVSRLHAILVLEDGATVVEDASSKNGLFVNGLRVRRAELRDGDTVAFGSVRYQYRIGPAP